MSDTDLNSQTAQSRYPELDQPLEFAWSGQGKADIEANNVSVHKRSTVSFVSQDAMPAHSQMLGTAQLVTRLSSHNESRLRQSETAAPSAFSVMEYPEQTESLRFQIGNPNSTEDDEDLSDAGSDYVQFRLQMANFKDSICNSSLLEMYPVSDDEIAIEKDVVPLIRGPGRGRGRPHGPGSGRGRSRGRGRDRRGIRGPRKPAEPTGDIKSRLSMASQAFIEERYIEARQIVAEVIRINAETYEAWILIASILKELGEIDKTMTALLCAAHLRPKDVAGWINCARFALEICEDRKQQLNIARWCYQAAIRANPKNDLEARCGKAAVLRELGNTASAIREYRRVLKYKPHDTSILRLLAEAYIDQENVQAAKDIYRQSIDFYMTSESTAGHPFGWSDINIYVELYAYLGQYDIAIKELKFLSRWALGREQESCWDKIVDDDREWDADDRRRVRVEDFDPSRFDTHLYGKGLPLELRVKLGLYRLRLKAHDEAMEHLYWLDPENLSNENRVFDYPDLFRETANTLHELDFLQEALVFYKALGSIPGQSDPSLYLQMGKCYLSEKLNTYAEECFAMVIQLDENNVEARVQLAKMYEDLNEQEQAFIYISEILNIRKTHNWKHRKGTRMDDIVTDAGLFAPASTGRKSYYKPKRLVDPAERQRQENLRAEHLLSQYAMMRLEQSGMRAGREGSTLAWMQAAQDLIEDFRGFKTFYPWDKYVHFLGYSGSAGAQEQTGATPLDVDLAAMADRLSHKLGANIEGRSGTTYEIPENYRGISFTVWLDIFLEYALCLVRFGREQESYEICEAAKDAIVFYHSPEDMFLIHVCWCTCAVLANDEATCVNRCRYFTKDYQFTTDTYRMFAALTRLCQSPISWYSSGPTQKYILRQIKAMDYALVDEESRKKFFAEKGSYSAQDESGHLLVNNDMDIALLMLYGHILYAGTSYPYALNYFFRAYALDPGNPMVNLSIGLGYIHYGLKRQSENRQFHIMQGLSCLFQYYESRRKSPRVEERQEAHHNIARAYHMLGITHLALPYYAKVLQESIEGRGEEDLARDAAYNLQCIYAMGGNFDAAKIITERWLVI